MDLNEVEVIVSLYENVKLTEEQRDGITDLAYKNHAENHNYYKISNDRGNTKEAVDEYNKNIENSQIKLVNDLKNLLGNEYENFENWFNDLWDDGVFELQ